MYVCMYVVSPLCLLACISARFRPQVHRYVDYMMCIYDGDREEEHRVIVEFERANATIQKNVKIDGTGNGDTGGHIM